MKTNRRDGESKITMLVFLIGCVLLGLRFGSLVSLGVFCIGLSVVGELQRKANQVLEALDRERQAPSAAQQAPAQAAAHKRLADAAEMLWVVLASVNGGDWTQQSPAWQEAAARRRDRYFAAKEETS